MVWISKTNEEGMFRWEHDLQEAFVLFLHPGKSWHPYKTIWVRTTVDVKLWRLVDAVVKFHSGTLNQEEIKEAWDAEDLVINFQGKPQSGEDFLSSYPNKCLIRVILIEKHLEF